MILLAICAGCAFVDFVAGDPSGPQDQYQAQFAYPVTRRGSGNPWVGQHADELTAALGPPDSILEARPRGSPFPNGVHVLSYIYYGDRSVRAACIDTYVVVEATGVIVKYYCR